MYVILSEPVSRAWDSLFLNLGFKTVFGQARENMGAPYLAQQCRLLSGRYDYTPMEYGVVNDDF